MLRRLVSRAEVVAARSFSTSAPRLVSPYTLFLKQAYKNRAQRAALSKVKRVPARGVMLGKWYKSLPRDEFAKLQTAAAKTKYKYRKARRVEKKSRKVTAYNKFVAKLSKTPAMKRLSFAKRMATIAKQWNAKKH